MTFHEVRFPDDISYGSRGGPRFSTAVVKLRSGAEERVARFSYPLHAYDVSYGIKSWEQLQAARDFFIARGGAAYGFRYKDFADYSSDPAATPNASTPAFDDVVIGTGDGTETQFQLRKLYEPGTHVVSRAITKPVAGTVKAGIDGVEKTAGTDFTVDTTSGVLTFTPAPGSGLDVTAGFEFDVPVRFDEDVDQNGLEIEIEAFEEGSIRRIPLLEFYVDRPITSDPMPMGGSDVLAFSSDITLTAAHNRFLVLNPSVAGLSVFLQDPTDLQTGGPQKYFVNIGAFSVTIKTSAGGTIFTLPAGDGATLLLATLSGAKTWYAF